MLTRGKLHIELLPPNFPGETEKGAHIMVAKVQAAVIIYRLTELPQRLGLCMM